MPMEDLPLQVEWAKNKKEKRKSEEKHLWSQNYVSSPPLSSAIWAMSSEPQFSALKIGRAHNWRGTHCAGLEKLESINIFFFLNFTLEYRHKCTFIQSLIGKTFNSQNCTLYSFKHRKNCKCCPVSLLIFRSQRFHEFRFTIVRIVFNVWKAKNL